MALCVCLWLGLYRRVTPPIYRLHRVWWRGVCVCVHVMAVIAVMAAGNAVHWAALQGNLPMCIWLRGIGLPLALANRQGHTALHKAAYKGHAELCRWLVENTSLVRKNRIECSTLRALTAN
jgi:hypothetical protein